MAFFSKFLPRTSSKYTVVLDIGSATVGIALVKMRSASSPEIFYLNRHSIVFPEGAGLQQLSVSLGDAIVAAGDTLRDWIAKKEKSFSIGNVHAIIHAPWVDSRSIRQTSNLSEESKITKEILQQFVERQFNSEPPQGRLVFDRHISSIELNGYPTTDPYGKKALDLAVTMLSSSMPETVHQEIMSAIETVFPEKDVHIDAFIRSTTQYAQKLLDTDEYTLLDVSGEYTTMHIIRGTSIIQSTRMQMGTLELLRGAGGTEEIDEAARSALIMYLANTCTPSQCRKVEKNLKPTEEKWLSAFTEALKEATQERTLPPILFVSVDSRFYPWFETFLHNDAFKEYTSTKRPFSPQLIRVQGEHRPVNMTGKATDNQLTLATFFAMQTDLA